MPWSVEQLPKIETQRYLLCALMRHCVQLAECHCRFVTSYDEANGEMTYLPAFFATIKDADADLAVLSGLHLLETQDRSVWDKRLRVSCVRFFFKFLSQNQEKNIFAIALPTKQTAGKCLTLSFDQELKSDLPAVTEKRPIHLELASMANANFITNVLTKVNF